MSSELLIDYGEDAATAQLGQLKLSTIEDQQWPADESHLSKSGETRNSFDFPDAKKKKKKSARCIFLMCVCMCARVLAFSETDLSQPFDASSPHLPWDHPFYDIARHQIIEVAGAMVSSLHLEPAAST